MRIKVRVPARIFTPGHQWEQRSPWSPLPYLASLTLHAVILGLTAYLPEKATVSRQADQPLNPNRKKLVWHRLEMLPKVSSTTKLPQAPTNRGVDKSKLQAVLTDPGKQRVKQFVFNPVPPPVIRQDIPTPDVIRAQMIVPVPPPAPPAPPKPKEFVPPTVARPAAPQTAIALPTEAPTVQMRMDPKSTPRSWMPAAGAPPPSTIKAAELPPSIAPVQGSSANTLAILSSAPASAAPPQQLPPSRAGQISRAEEVGAPAVRKGDEAGLRLPGVAVDRATPAAPPPVVEEKKPPVIAPAVPEIRYRMSQLGAAQNSVSAPQRPFARTIPAHVEKLFVGRNVYLMLIPMAEMDSYRGDWALWFGEKDPKADDGRVIAPLPRSKKLVPKGNPAPPREAKVRARLLIGVDGVPSFISILFCSDNSLEARAVEDLKLWQFRPAVKNGAPFEADVLLEYFYRVNSEPK